jgi:hypothetical protein
MANRKRRGKLPDHLRTYVVTRLAIDDTPSAIIRNLKENFGVSITRQAVEYCHPGRVAAGHLAQRWQDLFHECRRGDTSWVQSSALCVPSGANATKSATVRAERWR